MEPTPRQEVVPATSPVDVVAGASALVVGTVAGLARSAGPVVVPMVRIVLDPAILPPKLRPGGWLAALGRRGAVRRARIRQQFSQELDRLVPVVLSEVLRRAGLTTMITRYVDLDKIVTDVDLDAIATRLDVNAVARRVDIGAVLDRLDLTAVVMERVDLDTLIRAILDRIDLAALAEEVVDAVDLPEIIRESTGSMASDSVRGARMQGIAADEVIGRVRNRLLLRRGRGPGGETGAVPDPTEISSPGASGG
ncbi:MAG TPA: hypothetical protein VFZ32_07855 [Micromonosporaceae bacterium]